MFKCALLSGLAQRNEERHEEYLEKKEALEFLHLFGEDDIAAMAAAFDRLRANKGYEYSEGERRIILMSIIRLIREKYDGQPLDGDKMSG